MEKDTTIYIQTDPPVLFGGSQIREKNEVKGGAKPPRMWLAMSDSRLRVPKVFPVSLNDPVDLWVLS